jgi:hypothetical protein
VTTLPATARRFHVVRKRLLQQELLRRRLWPPTTLPPEGSIQAYWSEPCRPTRTAPLPVFLPSRGEVSHAISTAEHLKGPKPPRTRDMSYPRAFLVEPPNTSFVLRCQDHCPTGGLPATSFLLRWMFTSRAESTHVPTASAFPSGIYAGVPCRGFLWIARAWQPREQAWRARERGKEQQQISGSGYARTPQTI